VSFSSYRLVPSFSYSFLRFSSRFDLQILQRKRSRGHEVAEAMLVMDRERFGGLGGNVDRAAAHVEQRLPAACGFVEAARVTPRQGQRAKGVDFDRIERAARRAVQGNRPLVRLPRTRIEPGAREYVTERERLAGIARRRGPTLGQVEQSRCQRGEGQQIQTVVLQHRAERTGIARADELKVPTGYLEARHVTKAAVADQMLLEGQQGAIRALPELASGVKHVEVRHLDAEPREPMKEIAGLEHWGIERLAVEADERARARALARDGVEHRTLVCEPRHDELARDESPIVKPPAANEKGVGARSPAQTGRLEIEKDERRTCGRAAREERRLTSPGADSICQATDLIAAVSGRGFPPTVDDEAALAPLAAQG
jgi:hypothetical protein